MTASPDPSQIVSRQVDVGDASLYVSEVGAGFPVVWLHGSGPGASGLSNFASNLADFGDFRNIVIDHPRFGRSSKVHVEGPMIPFSGERILRALDALGVDSFALVGNSYGGGVSAWIAGTAPERVSHLILMAPGGLMPPSEQRPADGELPYGLRLISKAMTEPADLALMTEFTTAMLSDPGLASAELVSGRLEAARANFPEIEGDGVIDIGGVGEQVASITAKTLVVWGRDDRFLPLEMFAMLWLAAIPQAELHVFSHCGHWVQFERRDSFDQLVGDFLRAP